MDDVSIYVGTEGRGLLRIDSPGSALLATYFESRSIVGLPGQLPSFTIHKAPPFRGHAFGSLVLILRQVSSFPMLPNFVPMSRAEYSFPQQLGAGGTR